MAYIEFTTSDEIAFLHTIHTFGRKNPKANSSLSNDLISRNHASIEWENSKWHIQDFSRNGTWINGKQIESHTQIELREDDLVSLGSNDISGVSFRVKNLDKPQNLVYRPHPSLQIVPIDDSNLIPDPMSPDYGLYYCYGRRGWFSHKFNDDNNSTENYEEGPYSFGDEIRCSGNRWTLFLLDQDHASTAISRKPKTVINDVEFQIRFNRADDNVLICLLTKDNEIDLELQRYNKMLASLINLQQQSEDGWVLFKTLAKETGKNQANINLLLFMLRHHLATTLDHCAGVSTVIERNATSLRLGVKNYSIYRDGKLDQSSDYHI